MSSSLIA